MKILLIFILINMFGILANGQIEQDKTLALFIELKEQNICFGNSVEVIAKITNIGDSPVIIDTKRIGYRRSFDIIIDQQGEDLSESLDFIENIIPPKHYKPDFKFLLPNESYIKNLNLVFDNEFFAKAEIYRLQISYFQSIETKFKNTDVWQGIVKSNEKSFFMKKCK